MSTTKTVNKATIKTAPSTAPVEETQEVEIKKARTKVVEDKPVRKYTGEDLIPVRSTTQGELLMEGKKSGILYRWSAFGDIAEVEYQDLYSLKASRSSYLYSPLFVIEDKELLSDPKWKDLNKLYDSMYDSENFDEILMLSASQLKSVLEKMPTGYQNALKIEVATRIENGTFDSIQKIRALDEILDTDFMCLVV